MGERDVTSLFAQVDRVNIESHPYCRVTVGGRRVA